MEVWRTENEVGIGDLVRVNLSEGTTYYHGSEALEASYARAIREFCQQQGLELPDSFKEYEHLAAQATLVRVAEQNHNLDILATREGLRNLPDDPYGPAHYREYYDWESHTYVVESYTYTKQGRFTDALRVSLEEATAVVSSGFEPHVQVAIYPADESKQRQGSLDPEMQLWVRERNAPQPSRELEP